MSSSTASPVQGPISGHSEVDRVVDIAEMPVLCNALYETRSEAVDVARGDLTLGYVPRSGHIYNVAFDPDKISYTQTYENSLHHSPRFQEYATDLADRLIETYDVRDETVVDIGCGNGEFLSLLCERADNTGIGYDPSYDPGSRRDDEDRPVTIVQDLYSEESADHPADLICCRHVLEHVPDPLGFARRIRRAIGDRSDTVVYVEVPNALFTLRETAIWDLIYEHYSYFTPSSLTYLFRRAGFEEIRIGDAFDGQYLQAELRPGEPESNPSLGGDLDPARVTATIGPFVDRYRETRERWTDLFARVERQEQKAVLWGAGSKGVTILNMIPAAASAAEYVVDINPRKQGKYAAGTGHKIVPPTALREYRPDLIVLMNGIYEDEIRQTVGDLGLAPEFVVAT